MLFNKYHDGGKELRELLGFIDANTNFDKWLTWINLSLRQITELTGTEIFNQAETYYNQNSLFQFLMVRLKAVLRRLKNS